VNINLTLIIQMIVFALLVWFVMRFVWPHIIGAVDERTRKIALGLAAAEKGQQDFAQAEQRAEGVVREARERAHQIVEQAQRRATEMIEHARASASAEGARLLATAQAQIDLEAAKARESLRKDVAQLAIDTASKVLGREIDPRAHADLIDQLAAQI
jgi:F-type H+-transporting ATPase subunit b